MPTSLADLGLGRDDLHEAAERAANEITDNPRPFDADDLLALLQRAFDGQRPEVHVTDVFVVDAVRTPVGKLGGALAGVRPDDLAATALRGLVARGLDPDAVDEVHFGDANGAGEDNRNVAGWRRCSPAGRSRSPARP